MNKSLVCLITVIAIVSFGVATASAQTTTPVPRVTGPIPVTADSYAWLAANRTQEAADLAKIGYVEEEFIVSGTANIYDWNADGSLRVKTPNAPYTTRILVRRPADPARFSGNVSVELLNEARGYDWSFLWAISHPYFIEHGDAFVGITHMPQNVDALKKFNASRYASLSFANPNPAEACGPQNATSATEEGLHWDMISQVGALLKSKAATGPLAGLNVQYLYMSSHHGHAATYAVAIHSQAKLGNGKPVYDGYLLPSWDNPMRLSRCGAAPANGDPRQIVKNVGVPVIRVVPQGEVLGSVAARRPDSDEPGDRYRLYEVAGAPRMDKIYFQHLPAVEDQIKAGQPVSIGKWPFNYKCTPDIDLLDYPIKRYIINGAFSNLDRWVRTGTPPPRAERLALKNAGTPQANFETDEFGNARGGVRHPYVEVPTATYSGNTPGQCGNLAMKVPFDWARLQTLYSTPKNYTDKVVASLDRLLKERWVTESDANRIKAELIAPVPRAGSNNN